MNVEIEVEFHMGDAVRMRETGDVKGIVTAWYVMRGGNSKGVAHVKYEVTWCNLGAFQSRWFEAFELEIVK